MTTGMHKNLAHQLKELDIASLDSLTEDIWYSLLNQISNSYKQSDKDRLALEHSLQRSSDETSALYDSLKKSTATKLAAERDKLGAIINSMGIGLMMIGNDGRITLLNNTAKSMLNDQTGELVGMGLFDILLPDENAAVQPVTGLFEIQQLFDGRDQINCSNVFIKRYDRSQFPASVVLAPVDRRDKSLGAAVLFRDITNEKTTEEKLRLSSLVFNNTNNAVVISNPDGVVQAVNRAFLKITGFSEREAIGHAIEELLNIDVGAESLHGVISKLKSDQSWEGELNLNKKSSKPFQAWVTVTATTAETGGISQYLTIFTDISILQQSTQQLHHLAHHDVLTNLPNRLLFHKALGKSLEEARNNKTLLAILFLDLDRFKIINDSMGHPVGDELLTTVALRLQSLVGNQYIVSRFGGDEFTILMDGIKNKSEAASLAERITKEIERPVFLNGAETFITTSIGICIYPEHGQDAIELIRNADAAMYYAKASGRNNYQFYYNALNEKATANIKLESSLRYALDKNEFVLHYQPQIALGTKSITGFEALIRWQHPTLGLLTPDKFLDVAIETGLIIPIGRWVLSEACNNIVRLNKSSAHAVRIAVNLSTHQIMFGDIAADIKAVLAETGIKPERLELEITESSFMQHEEHTISALRKVEAMGVKFAIDDFGTGYASMEYLKKFPVDRLKIDRTFIKDLAHGMMDKAIVRSIITLGHSITIPVVAEGVETQEQLDILNSMLCNEAQGFYFSPAVTADAAEEMLALSLSPEE